MIEGFVMWFSMMLSPIVIGMVIARFIIYLIERRQNRRETN